MTCTIGLVEDDDIIRANLSEFLEARGFSVCAYADRSRASEAFRSEPPDIALLDVALGSEREGGFKLCSEIREFSETIPVIFLTSYDAEADKMLSRSQREPYWIYGQHAVLAADPADQHQDEQRAGSDPFFDRRQVSGKCVPICRKYQQGRNAQQTADNDSGSTENRADHWIQTSQQGLRIDARKSYEQNAADVLQDSLASLASFALCQPIALHRCVRYRQTRLVKPKQQLIQLRNSHPFRSEPDFVLFLDLGK